MTESQQVRPSKQMQIATHLGFRVKSDVNTRIQFQVADCPSCEKPMRENMREPSMLLMLVQYYKCI